MKACDAALEEQRVVSGEGACAQSNMLEENALLQPAADINYGSGATSVPLAVPV